VDCARRTHKGRVSHTWLSPWVIGGVIRSTWDLLPATTALGLCLQERFRMGWVVQTGCMACGMRSRRIHRKQHRPGTEPGRPL